MRHVKASHDSRITRIGDLFVRIRVVEACARACCRRRCRDRPSLEDENVRKSKAETYLISLNATVPGL